MASKFGLAGGIPERRVRPIWDAIDSRQFKNALKLSTALLSKYPKSPYALALKALILERMGKPDEALSICLNAKDLMFANDTFLMDDLTLSTLQIVFQRLDHLDLATSCYEYACGKFPNNLELMMGLFNCYVREYSFVKQQQTAIKMYKIVGEERYLMWAVCSIQLQVLCSNGGEKLLSLAEGLIKKHIAAHSLHEPEALMVYISILEQQAKYNDALEILSGKLGSLLMIEVDKLRIQGKLHARAGDYTAAANVFQRMLELCPDDWECFLNYLSSLLEDDSNWCGGVVRDPIHPPRSVPCKLSQLADDVFDSRISDASAFVQKLQANTSNHSLRCPFLANLEIERRKHLYGKGNDDTLMEALMQYFLRFGHLACFASDVEMFLEVLSPDKRTEVLEKLRKSSDSPSSAPAKFLGQSITLNKIQELFGNLNNFSVNELSGCAMQMAELYCTNLPLSKDLDPQESMVGEELLSMVCNILVQLFYRTRNTGYIIEAIMVLEFGLTIRRFVWQYKMLLLHLYSHLGALSLSYERYKSMDVKNILLETVSHHILPQMLVSPLWVDLSNLLKDYLKFMDDHLRESADLTFLAHRHRNYTKVIEFVQFKERLQQSNQYLAAKIEAPILELKKKANNIEEEETVLESMKSGIHCLELSNEIGSKTLTFNEDFQTRPWWTPTPEENYLIGAFEGISSCPRENLSKEREANVRRVIEKRSVLPRMIHLSVQSASASLKENIKSNSSSSDPKISLELKLLLERYAENLGFSLNDAIDVIVEVSCGNTSSKDLDCNVVDWMNFAVFWNAWNLCSGENELPNGDKCSRHSSWEIVNSLFEKLVVEKVRSLDNLVCSSQGVLPILVQLITEPFAWHGLVIHSFVRACVPSGKKKKKSGSTDQSVLPLCSAVRDSIEPLGRILEEVMQCLKERIICPEDENLELLLSPLQNKEQNDGPGRVFQILESLVSSVNGAEVGDRIYQALQSWCPVDVVRRIIKEQRKVLSEFFKICESKFESLKALKQQMSQF